jgi:uncharacterized protein (TIGR02001 family)
MENAMNLKSKTALAALTLIASSTVFAQAKPPEPDYTLAYNIGAVSDYRFRGVTQTNYGPAVQGGIDFAHKSGFYLGAWASNINWVKQVNGASKGDYELDLYGGYKGEIKPGLSYDVGVITYQYPGNDSGQASSQEGAGLHSDASTYEFYGALTWDIFTFKYSQSVGDFLGNLNSNGSRYYDLSASFDLGNGYSLVPHIGHQTIPNQSAGTKTGNAADYNDAALTLGKDFGNGFSASLAYVATDADSTFYANQGGSIGDGKGIAKSGAFIGVKYTF